MATIHDIYSAIDKLAPFKYAESWDNCGLLIGDKSAVVQNALLCLDVTSEIIDEAVEKKANLIITHHPIIFNPIKSISSNTNVHKLIRNNISVLSAHTNLDVAKGFVNDILAENLSLKDIEHLEILSNAEETISLGRIGVLEKAMSVSDFAMHVKKSLRCDKLEFTMSTKQVKKIAVCGGSGGSLIGTAILKGADALVTGDVKHDQFLLAHELGLILIDAGHFATEEIVLEPLQEVLSTLFPDIYFMKTTQPHIVHTI